MLDLMASINSDWLRGDVQITRTDDNGRVLYLVVTAVPFISR